MLEISLQIDDRLMKAECHQEIRLDIFAAFVEVMREAIAMSTAHKKGRRIHDALDDYRLPVTVSPGAC